MNMRENLQTIDENKKDFHGRCEQGNKEMEVENKILEDFLKIYGR